MANSDNNDKYLIIFALILIIGIILYCIISGGLQGVSCGDLGC
jgi:hypothetical protein